MPSFMIAFQDASFLMKGRGSVIKVLAQVRDKQFKIKYSGS